MMKVQRLLGIEFTDEQKSALSAPTEGLQKVVAGAGTGKTQVIVGRFLYLVVERGYEPHRILCITFTDYAASEMRQRISEALRKAEFIGTECSAVSTFHSFCYGLLRRYREEAKLPEEFPVLSDGEQRLILNTRVKNSLLQKPLDFEFLTTASLNISFERAVELMNKARSQLFSADEFEQKMSGELEKEFDSEYRLYKEEMLRFTLSVWREYERLKREFEVLDYDDLILKALSLLEENPAIKDEIQSLYQYILVDEYQDTSVMQQKLLELVAEKDLSNVTVVGDVRQSIYSWRDAYPEGLARLKGNEHRLDVNFRSCNEILELANEMVNADSSLPRSALFNKRYEEPKEKRIFLRLFKDIEEQKEFLVERIEELRAKYALDEIAVLARSRSRLKNVEEALENAAIPYKSFAHSIYDSPLVLDIAQWIRILTNEFDKKSLIWVLSRDFGLSPSDLIPLNRTGDEFSLREALDVASGALAEAIKEIIRISSRVDSSRIPALLIGIVDFLPIEKEQELADFERILEKGIMFQSSRRLYTPTDFANYLEQMHRTGANEPQSNPYLLYNAVKLLTFHSAKGLEFDVVFLFDVTEKSVASPHIILDTDDLDIVPAYLPYRRKEKHSKHRELSEQQRERLQREERRLLHVAVTRARELLYITGPYGSNRRKFNNVLKEALSTPAVRRFVSSD